MQSPRYTGWNEDSVQGHSNASRSSPLLTHGSDIDLVRPTSPTLTVQVPIRLGNRFWINLLHLVFVLQESLCPRNINGAVDDRMTDMNSSRVKFSCYRLRQATQTKLGGAEYGKECRSFD